MSNTNQIKRKNRLFNNLFWQVSAIFLVVLVLFAAITLYISVNAARDYSEEVNQKLNQDLAKNMVDVIKPNIQNDSINQDALAEIMHSMMVINPSVEVYLLNPEGKILSYVAPYKVVKLEEVSLQPIARFLNNNTKSIIYGDDPRNPGEEKIFSATRIMENNELKGYLYIVLASQAYVSTSEAILSSYILGISIRTIVAILLVTAVVGILAIWFLTKKLKAITRGIQQFREGNLKVRIPVKANGELDAIGHAFNEMACTVERSIEELKGIDQLRKELISNVSHDLRTPVASIQGYAETLLIKKENIQKEEQEKYLNIIYKSCEQLQKLVTELFDLSKLQTNQVKLEMEPFSIAELVHDVANKYRIISQKKGISINTIVSKDIPLVKADISLIDRVLQNLIDNAVKFCREGDYINLEIDLLNPGKVQIKIVDSGIGIEQEELPHIFERYYKGTHHNSTGLGLAIVKKIIDLHESDIEVSSQPEKGTTFSFNLPVALTA